MSVVKAMIEAGNVRTTKAAREGGATLGMDFESMIAVVKTLTTTDLYKSMTIYTDPNVAGCVLTYNNDG